MAHKISNFPASDTRLWLVEFYRLFCIQVQDSVSLEIKKKRGSSIDLDIHHSKVPIVDFFDSLPNPPFWKFLLGFDQWACDWILDSFLIKLNCSSFLIKLNCSSFLIKLNCSSLLIKLNCSFPYLMLFFW